MFMDWKIQYCKDINYPILNYRLNAILIKTPLDFLVELGKEIIRKFKVPMAVLLEGKEGGRICSTRYQDLLYKYSNKWWSTGIKTGKLTNGTERRVQKQTHTFMYTWLIIKISLQGFHGGAVVKNMPANAGTWVPGPGRSHMPRTTKPMSHNHWALCHNYWSPRT